MRIASMIPLAVIAVALGTLPWVVRGDEPSSDANPQHQVPKDFVPVDTRRLMGSPDPLALEAVPAFPRLKFKRPVELTFAADGTKRLFVVEQAGIIRVFDNAADASESKVFLDLRDRVLSEGNEEGLLGLAFHPKYAENGLFYVNYTTKPRATIVATYRVSKDDVDRADTDSEERLLTIPQPYENHNGGSIQFGKDGFLYIGMGDGGLRDDPHDNAQNLGVLLGKILRIDVDHRDGKLPYAIPSDNPFVNREGTRGEIWAYGFRNIWRLGFDRETGELWEGEVGQDRFEEINLIRRGGNYGWNIREGRHDFQPHTPAKPDELIDPVTEYFRGEGQSVTGGFVYRGEKLKSYRGFYFYGDYLSGNVWALRLDRAGRLAEKRQVARTGLQIAAFGQDRAGEMYLCAFDGMIYQLRARDIDTATMRRDFPSKLSETGLFESVPENRPAAGLIPYELNVPFWSDYAVKDRYLALPKARSVEFTADEAWKLPLGAVLVKTFWMHHDRVNMAKPRRLETRLLVNSNDGWVGYTYVYDDDQREAHLLDGALSKSLEIETAHGQVNQTYYFPSRTDCMTCHTKQHGFVLGLETAQLNRTQRYHGHSENQLKTFERLKVFTKPLPQSPDDLDKYPDWGFGNLRRDGSSESNAEYQAPRGDVNKLARAWLDVNCAMCHLPDGIAPLKRDMRFESSLTKMNLVDQSPSKKRRRADNVRLIAPGDPLHSDLLWRISERGPNQMPPLATHYVDPHAEDLLRRWIAGLKPQK